MSDRVTGSQLTLPWADWMIFAFGPGRMAPQTFWSLSLIEWAALLKAHAGDPTPPMSRTEMTGIMRQFPDEVRHG